MHCYRFLFQVKIQSTMRVWLLLNDTLMWPMDREFPAGDNNTCSLSSCLRLFLSRAFFFEYNCTLQTDTTAEHMRTWCSSVLEYFWVRVRVFCYIEVSLQPHSSNHSSHKSAMNQLNTSLPNLVKKGIIHVWSCYTCFLYGLGTPPWPHLSRNKMT